MTIGGGAVADPVTLSLVALGVSGVASAGAVASSYGQAQAAKDAADYNAEAASLQARVTRQQQSAAEEIQRQGQRAQLSEQLVGITEGGLGTAGSALALYEQSVRAAELDTMTGRYETELRASGLMMESEQQRTQAKAAGKAGRIGLLTGILGAGADIAGGAALYNRRYGGGTSYAPTDRNGYGPGGR
jgi:hypothetical protein